MPITTTGSSSASFTVMQCVLWTNLLAYAGSSHDNIGLYARHYASSFWPVFAFSCCICIKCSLGCSGEHTAYHSMCTSQLLCVALSALWMPCFHEHQNQEWSGLHLWLKMSDHVWQTPARVDGLDQIACQTMIKSQSTTKRQWQFILLCKLFQQKTQITLRAFVHRSIFKHGCR